MNFKVTQQAKVSQLVEKFQQRILIANMVNYGELNIEDNMGDQRVHVKQNPLQSVIKQCTKAKPIMALTNNSAIMSHCACAAKNCITLKSILETFKAPLNEEQAWALIYQYTSLYRELNLFNIFNVLELPQTMESLCLHPDGSVHFTCEPNKEHRERAEHLELLPQRYQPTSKHTTGRADVHRYPLGVARKLLHKLAILVYAALDYKLRPDEQYQLSNELEALVTYMIVEENEGDGDGDDEGDAKAKSHDGNNDGVKILDYVLDVCRAHVASGVPEKHYKGICCALVIEANELRLFLQQVYKSDALHFGASTEAKKPDAIMLAFADWARYWLQVNDEVRNGVQLRKYQMADAPLAPKLTPYETLLKDIRAQKYKLRKVLLSDNIPSTDIRRRHMTASALAKG